MEIEIVKNEYYEEVYDYPCFMISKDEKTILLVTKNDGTFLSGTDLTNNVGEYWDCWISTDFIPFTGQLKLTYKLN